MAIKDRFYHISKRLQPSFSCLMVKGLSWIIRSLWSLKNTKIIILHYSCSYHLTPCLPSTPTRLLTYLYFSASVLNSSLKSLVLLRSLTDANYYFLAIFNLNASYLLPLYSKAEYLFFIPNFKDLGVNSSRTEFPKHLMAVLEY